MDEILKAIENMKEEINRRIDLLEIQHYKENTLLLKDIHKNLAESSGGAKVKPE